MIGLEIDQVTGLPKFRKSVWTQIEGTIPALGSNVVIDSLPLSEFDSLNYKMDFKGQTQDDVRKLNMDVQQKVSSISEVVFARQGSLSISLTTQINGSSFELLATNTGNFEVEYCLTVLTT